MNRENLANAELAAAINDSQTSITLKTGQGGNFTQFPLVCTMTPPGQLSTKDNSEVVLLTDVTSDTATITRAQYGFSAKSFPIGSIIANGIYKEDFDAIQDAIDLKYDASNPDGFVDATGAASAAPVQSVAGKTGDVTLDKADVGLPKVNDTSDAEKPVSTATQMALNEKANAFDTVNLTGNQTIAGVKTFSSSPVVPTATTGTQAVNKAQMDAADALKVDKTSTPSQIYRTMPNGSQSTITYDDNATAWTIPRRVGSGELLVATPWEANHATTKAYVDARVPITGTGFPNGVVSAPVGSTYIDTAATNGAIEWKKATGTGNTGWVVSVGDTGWRNIASLIYLPDYYSVANTDVSYLRIRRFSNTVHLLGRVDIVASTTTTPQNLVSNSGLAGFHSPIAYSPIIKYQANNGWSTPTDVLGRSALSASSSDFAQLPAGGNISIDRVWSTTNNWPATLPGTAV